MIEKIIDKIIKYGKIAAKSGYTPGYSGNISVRYSDNILITSTGSANGFLKEEDISVIDFLGEPKGVYKKPSSEKFLHIEFYKKRPDINAIMHFHSPYLSAFAASGTNMDEKVMAEIVYAFGQIPLADYALPGSSELVNNTSKYFEQYDVVLMKNHGVIVGGKDLKDAFLKLETAEAYAKTLICAKLLGGVNILPENEVEKIYNLRKQ